MEMDQLEFTLVLNWFIQRGRNIYCSDSSHILEWVAGENKFNMSSTYFLRFPERCGPESCDPERCDSERCADGKMRLSFCGSERCGRGKDAAKERCDPESCG